MKNRILITAACLLALLSTIGASLPYPILPPLFAAEAPNAFNNFLGLPSKLLFGLALTINPLGLLIGSALLGPLSDRYGRRPLLMRTAVGAAIGHAITAWALVIQSYPLFIVARFITGLLEGNGAVARAMLADQLQGPLRLRAMSWLNGAFYLGWLVGPILAGATLAWGVTVPFWIAAGALMLVAVLVAIGLPRETPSLLTTSWWQVQRPYNDSAVNKLMTGSAPVSFATCPNPDAPNDSDYFVAGDTVYLTAFYKDQLSSQTSTYRLLSAVKRVPLVHRG